MERQYRRQSTREAEIAETAAASLVGESNVGGLLPNIGAEDFACFLEIKPICIGNRTAEGQPNATEL
jgi:hypothetical protein